MSCKNGCNAPTIPKRRVCIDCHRAEQREVQRRIARMRRNPNFTSESCNCQDPKCNGVHCNYLRAV